MAGKKKAETTEIVEVNPLELQVTKNIVGVLETNIDELEKYVNTKLEEYKPELYSGNADSAKKARAELNNAKKVLAQTRINIMKKVMKPYEDFETRCKNLEKNVDSASGLLDEIVKAKEQEEKDAKKKRCEDLWLTKNFALFSLDKVFNPKWLNKGTTENDISNEMDVIIERTYKDLKVIEKYGLDVDTLKAHYLMSLDIQETLAYGEELSKAREKAEEEKKNREEREYNQQLENQQKELVKEALAAIDEKPMNELASQALGIVEEKKPSVKEYVVSIKATEEQLHRLKMACNALGIVYSVEELSF